MGGLLSDCPLLSMPLAACHQCFLHGDFRITPSFTFSYLPPTTLSHGDFWNPARRRIGPLHHYTAGMMFSHFLIYIFANFLIYSQATTLLANGHGHLLP